MSSIIVPPNGETITYKIDRQGVGGEIAFNQVRVTPSDVNPSRADAIRLYNHGSLVARITPGTQSIQIPILDGMNQSITVREPDDKTFQGLLGEIGLQLRNGRLQRK